MLSRWNLRNESCHECAGTKSSFLHILQYVLVWRTSAVVFCTKFLPPLPPQDVPDMSLSTLLVSRIKSLVPSLNI
jgi:hypothetical protein